MNADEIEVWRIPLADSRGDAAVLSAAESERAARFHFEKHRREWIACRSALRMLLGRYAGIKPEDVEFRFGPHGKPSVDAGFEFNVSHTEGLALIAFALSPVGIDVERTDRRTDTAGVAAHCFSPAEIADLAGREPSAFFEYWTCKEACIKAEGGGLSIALDAFTVAASPRADGWREVAGLPWIVRTLDAGAGYRAAVAAPPRAGGWTVIERGAP